MERRVSEAMFRRRTAKRILRMADRASASIIIGGSVPRSFLPRLIRAIEEDHGLTGWDGEPVDDRSIVAGQLLEAYAFELPGGIFESVECLCEANNIPFVRSSGSFVGVFGQERVVFDGLHPARHYELNESEEIVLTRRDLIKLGSLEFAEAWFAAADYTPAPIEITDDIGGHAEPRELDHG